MTQDETLQQVLDRYGFEIPAEQVAQLERFCELLWAWNAKINLTRHTTYEKFVTRDLLDTLAFSEFLAPGERVLDVGSGSGVPGILLGILRPDLTIAVAECVGKKAKALADIIHELKLPIPVYEALGQDILGNWQFHTLTFRAVASMRKLLEWFRGTWVHFDRMLLVKGPRWLNERGEARHYGLFKGLALRKLKEYPALGAPLDDPEQSAEQDAGPKQDAGPTQDAEAPVKPRSGNVILQICPQEKLGPDDLCVLTAWETSKSRNRYDGRRRKTRVDGESAEDASEPGRGSRGARERRADRNPSANRTNRIRNNTHRKSGANKEREHGHEE